jgi:hypothetical protein
MKKTIKFSVLPALLLSVAALGTNHAQAGPWPIAVGVASGVAAGAIVGTAIAASAATPAPVYYAYPPAVYAPAAVPVPAPVAVAPAPVYYPRPAVYPYYAYSYPYVYRPWVRFGYGPYWGRPYYRHYYRR